MSFLIVMNCALVVCIINPYTFRLFVFKNKKMNTMIIMGRTVFVPIFMPIS